MKTGKMVSVIIPVYNCEAYVEKAVQSIINQTLQAVEIICVNDGSVDGSLAVLERCAREDERVRVISQENRGVSAARNAGLQAAEGRYIYFMDSDDWLEADALEKLSAQAIEQELDILYFNYDVFSDEEDMACRLAEYDRGYVLHGDYPSAERGMQMFCKMYDAQDWRATVWRQLYRHEFLRKHQLSFREGMIHEDILYSVDAALAAERVAFCNEQFYHRRIRINSIMTTPKSYANFMGYEISWQEILRHAMTWKLPEQVVACLCRYAERLHAEAVRLYLSLPEEQQVGVTWTQDPIARTLFSIGEEKRCAIQLKDTCPLKSRVYELERIAAANATVRGRLLFSLREFACKLEKKRFGRPAARFGRLVFKCLRWLKNQGK